MIGKEWSEKCNIISRWDGYKIMQIEKKEENSVFTIVGDIFS